MVEPLIMKKVALISNFFSSVNLALATLTSLALTSIFGTIIPQKEAAELYIKKYGATFYRFIQIFDISDMYNSWWFLALLGLLCTNLLFCTFERFPGVWRIIKADNLAISLERLDKMSNSSSFVSPFGIAETVEKATGHLAALGWQAKVGDRAGGKLLFCQKGAWSRLGVYIVHTSILIIFSGAILGHLYGFKGSILLPELKSSDRIFLFGNNAPLRLGFEVRCDRFDILFHANGSPKEYLSKLTILENGKEVMSKVIEVNSPLTYKGITFYQASYQGYRDFLVGVTEKNMTEKVYPAEFRKEILSKENNLRFGIINLEKVRDRITRLKIWFSDGNGAPSEFWLNSGEQVQVDRSGREYLVSAKQRYGTGLQVAKDPGIWLVYLGCGLMLCGLYLAFFMSHKRIWLLVNTINRQTVVLIGGSTNKNKVGFDTLFIGIAKSLGAAMR